MVTNRGICTGNWEPGKVDDVGIQRSRLESGEVNRKRENMVVIRRDLGEQLIVNDVGHRRRPSASPDRNICTSERLETTPSNTGRESSIIDNSPPSAQ